MQNRAIWNSNVQFCFLDDDECSRNNGDCEQICTNLPGIYECSCRTGFLKDATDHKKCVGKFHCTMKIHQI